MRYVSLFSGIGGFEVGLQRSRFSETAECVGYSEIDRTALGIYQRAFNHPALGDITGVDYKSLPDFDLLVGGSPCQNLSSMAVDRRGLEGDKSKLFFAYLDVLETKKPRYFILENVASMSKVQRDRISSYLGVEPVFISSSRFSAQARRRYYWCNFPIRLEGAPERFTDVTTRDIIIENDQVTDTKWRSLPERDYVHLIERISEMQKIGRRYVPATWNIKAGVVAFDQPIAQTLVAQYCPGTGYYKADGVFDTKEYKFRIWNSVERERLQTFDDNFTQRTDTGKIVPVSPRIKVTGNAVNCNTIAFIANELYHHVHAERGLILDMPAARVRELQSV